MRRAEQRHRAAVLVPGWVLVWQRFGEQGSRGAVPGSDPSPFASCLAVPALLGSLSHCRCPTPVSAKGTNMHSQTTAPQTGPHVGSLNAKCQCSFLHAPFSHLILPCFPCSGSSCHLFPGGKGSWSLQPSLLPPHFVSPPICNENQ